MSNWENLIVVLLAGGLLSACASRQEVARMDADYCSSIGLKFGTADYATCRMVRTQSHDIADENRRNRMMGLGLRLMNQ